AGDGVHHHHLRFAGDHGEAVRHSHRRDLVWHGDWRRHWRFRTQPLGVRIDDGSEVGTAITEEVPNATSRQQLEEELRCRFTEGASLHRLRLPRVQGVTLPSPPVTLLSPAVTLSAPAVTLLAPAVTLWTLPVTLHGDN